MIQNINPLKPKFGAVRFAKPGEKPGQGERKFRVKVNLGLCPIKRGCLLSRELGKNSQLIISDFPVNGATSDDLTIYNVIRDTFKTRQKLKRLGKTEGRKNINRWYQATLAMDSIQYYNARLLNKARINNIKEKLNATRNWFLSKLGSKS